MSARYQTHSWHVRQQRHNEQGKRAALLRHSQQTPLACSRYSPDSDERHRINPLSSLAGRFARSNSPEPLMCAGTRDKPPPRLTAVWWRNRSIRVDDVHRTSAVAVDDGIIDAVRPEDTRSPTQPRPRVSPSAREGHVRLTRGRKKGKDLVRVYLRICILGLTSYQPRRQFSLARAKLVAACWQISSAHATSARATGGSINPSAGNATFSRDIPRRSIVAAGIRLFARDIQYFLMCG